MNHQGFGVGSLVRFRASALDVSQKFGIRIANRRPLLESLPHIAPTSIVGSWVFGADVVVLVLAFNA